MSVQSTFSVMPGVVRECSAAVSSDLLMMADAD